jgi:hypothetical protein
MTIPDYPVFDGSQSCAGADPEAWFPEDSSLARENRIAKAICGTCTWIDPCLEYALYVRVDGIWGGTVQSERQAIRRRRNISAIPVYMTMTLPRPITVA